MITNNDTIKSNSIFVTLIPIFTNLFFLLIRR